MPKARVCALVIGDEVLSGKVSEANLRPLALALRAQGLTLSRALVLPDDVAIVAAAVRDAKAEFDWVITSGGVGPTHDDITTEAVARAFSVPVVLHPELRDLLETHYGTRCTPEHLRMARVPSGSTLERPDAPDAMVWPTVRKENVWMLPGIPELFLRKLDAVLARLPATERFVTIALYTQMDEGTLKPQLDELVATFPDVQVGSYPAWNQADYRTKVTLDAQNEARLEEAATWFLDRVPPDWLVRREKR